MWVICGNNIKTFNVIINLEHVYSFKNGYICIKQTDKSYYNRQHRCSRVYCAPHPQIDFFIFFHAWTVRGVI